MSNWRLEFDFPLMLLSGETYDLPHSRSVFPGIDDPLGFFNLVDLFATEIWGE